jgi:hypothetical protein
MIEQGGLNPRLLDYLQREVEDLLDAGVVGLYEFPQILRGEAPDMPDPEVHAHASAVLDRLLASGRTRLVWDRWADSQPPVDAGSAAPQERDWQAPPDERYLAVDSIS